MCIALGPMRRGYRRPDNPFRRNFRCVDLSICICMYMYVCMCVCVYLWFLHVYIYVYSFGSYAEGLPETGQSFSEEFQVEYLSIYYLYLSICVYMYMYICIYVCT